MLALMSDVAVSMSVQIPLQGLSLLHSCNPSTWEVEAGSWDSSGTS